MRCWTNGRVLGRNKRENKVRTYQLGSGIPNANDKASPTWETAAYSDFRLMMDDKNRKTQNSTG